MDEENQQPFDGDDPADEFTGRFEAGSSGNGADGFVPPAERRWIHPSELSFGSESPVPSHRLGRGTIILGVAAVSVLIAGVAVFSVRTQPASTTLAISTVSNLSSAPTALQQSARSLVSVSSVQHGATEITNGIAIDPRHIVTTAALPLKGTVNVTTSSGQEVPATVIRNDAPSGLTVLEAGASLTGYVNGSTAQPSSELDVVSMTTTAQSSSMRWAAASGVKSHQTLARDPMPLSVVTASSALPPEAGALLVDGSGDVVAVEAPSLGSDVFLPVSYVTAVGGHLASPSPPTHGYLRVVGTDAPGPGGAKITSISADSPAAGKLQVDDVVTHVGDQQIATMAELVDALYALPPSSSVDLLVRRGTATQVVSVTLAPSP